METMNEDTVVEMNEKLCSKCGFTDIESGQMELQEDYKVEYLRCKQCDSKSVEVRLQTSRVLAVMPVLYGLGVAPEKVEEAARDIDLLYTTSAVDDYKRDFFSISSAKIDLAWKVICRCLRVAPPDGSIPKSDRHLMSSRQLELLIYREGGWPETNYEINFWFWWPMRALAAMGRIHFGDVVWRLK